MYLLGTATRGCAWQGPERFPTDVSLLNSVSMRYIRLGEKILRRADSLSLAHPSRLIFFIAGDRCRNVVSVDKHWRSLWAYEDGIPRSYERKNQSKDLIASENSRGNRNEDKTKFEQSHVVAVHNNIIPHTHGTVGWNRDNHIICKVTRLQNSAAEPRALDPRSRRRNPIFFIHATLYTRCRQVCLQPRARETLLPA